MLYKAAGVRGRVEDSPEPASAESGPGSRPRGGSASRSPEGEAWGGGCPRQSQDALGAGQAGPAGASGRGRSGAGRGGPGGRRWRSAAAASQGRGPPLGLRVVGGLGRTGCRPTPPSPWPGPTAQRPRGPCLSWSARGPAQPAGLWPSSAAPVGTLVQQGLPARQQRGGRAGGPGWAVSGVGGLPSGFPEQQDPSVSLAGLTGQVGASGGLTPRC